MPTASLPLDRPTRESVAGGFDVISVDNLPKRFGEFWALRGASFSIRRGEILRLIGPNGSGKTTLFQCFAGIAPATLGRVERDATPVSPDERKQLLFFVPDGVRPWGDQSVAWTLRFTAGLHGVSAEKVADLNSSLGLTPLVNSRLRELSKGEHRRVLLAMGLLTPHPLLMLDEPFDGLDLRRACRASPHDGSRTGRITCRRRRDVRGSHAPRLGAQADLRNAVPRGRERQGRARADGRFCARRHANARTPVCRRSKSGCVWPSSASK